MKFYKITALIVTLLVVGAFGVQAQWDDVYYDPDKDVIVESTNRYSSRTDNTRSSRYYDDEQGYYNDYDFYYTSRIRRFHRPMFGFGFFDPVYIDAMYYDPFMRPGMTMLIYDDYYTRRAWARSSFWYSPFNRFNRFNSFGSFYDPFYSPFGYNSFYGSRFGFGFGASPFGYYSSFNGLYCPPSWGNSYNYNNATNYYSDVNSRGTTFTPRRSGSSLSPNPNVSSRRGTVGDGRNTTTVTVDGKRPYPYSPAGSNSLKPNSRNPEFSTTNSRERSRARSATAQPYSGTRNSTINNNSNRTRSRSITPSSRTRTRTINSGSSRTRTRSITPSSSGSRINSGSSSTRSRVSSPTRSSTRSSTSSSSSRTRSSSSGSSRSRGNN